MIKAIFLTTRFATSGGMFLGHIQSCKDGALLCFKDFIMKHKRSINLYYTQDRAYNLFVLFTSK
jgi:hypothetical protein